MRAFVENLRVMDGPELGLLAAMTTHQANTLKREKGWDFKDPTMLVFEHPGICVTLRGAIKDMQKQQKFQVAASAMVLLHTARSAHDLRLRGAAREMWGEMKRGFPYVEVSALDLFHTSGEFPNIEGFDRFPEGLTPEPL